MFDLSTEAGSLSPIAMFLHADVIGKSVIVLLLLASIWVWTIIVVHGRKLATVRRQTEAFERDFWKASDIDRFHESNGKSEMPSARVLAAGLAEWRRSTARPVVDRAGVRERISTVLDAAVANEIDALGDRLNLLATVGAVAPFVGLFGTVWGIMRSFSEIEGAGNASLAVVAPGLAEALFATAIGLFAAIPAVIAYNRFGHALNRIETRLYRFADGFQSTLSRELERS